MTPCWIWTGNRNSSGYGRIKKQGKMRLVHRLAYELFVGAVPDGMVLDHLCRQRGCCNPAHLRPVTNRENLLAPGSRALTAKLAAKTHCPLGHEYTSENTALQRYRSGRTTRRCRRCCRERQAIRILDPVRKAARDQYLRAYNERRTQARREARI